MQRASILNEDNCGFHARSVLVDTAIPAKILELMPGTKGYSDPTLDNEGTMLVRERPVEARNLKSHDVTSDGMSLIEIDPMRQIFPCRFWRESWKWERLMEAYDEGKWLRRRLQTVFDVNFPEKKGLPELKHYWYATLQAHPSNPTWRLYLTTFQDRFTVMGRDLGAQIYHVMQTWIDRAGLSSHLTLHEDDSTRCCFLEVNNVPLPLPPSTMESKSVWRLQLMIFISRSLEDYQKLSAWAALWSSLRPALA